VSFQAGELIFRCPDDDLKFQASPGRDGAAGELAVGFHEPLVEEDRGESGPVAKLVTETEPERGTDDERDQLL